jgi:hypothetical protein
VLEAAMCLGKAARGRVAVSPKLGRRNSAEQVGTALNFQASEHAGRNGKRTHEVISNA